MYGLFCVVYGCVRVRAEFRFAIRTYVLLCVALIVVFCMDGHVTVAAWLP